MQQETRDLTKATPRAGLSVPLFSRVKQKAMMFSIRASETQTPPHSLVF